MSKKSSLSPPTSPYIDINGLAKLTDLIDKVNTTNICTEQVEQSLFASLVPEYCGGMTYEEVMSSLKKHHPERFI